MSFLCSNCLHSYSTIVQLNMTNHRTNYTYNLSNCVNCTITTLHGVKQVVLQDNRPYQYAVTIDAHIQQLQHIQTHEPNLCTPISC